MIQTATTANRFQIHARISLETYALELRIITSKMRRGGWPKHAQDIFFIGYSFKRLQELRYRLSGNYPLEKMMTLERRMISRLGASHLFVTGKDVDSTYVMEDDPTYKVLAEYASREIPHHGIWTLD